MSIATTEKKLSEKSTPIEQPSKPQTESGKTELPVRSSEWELIPANAKERLGKAIRLFEEVKREALRESDFAIIQGKKHVKKSGCSLLAAVCNVSTQKLDERVEDLSSVERVYHFTYRAVAPNGRFADAVGSASTKEKQFTHLQHDVRTLAQTRAYNRCILNLVAAGEVSAEEMLSHDEGEAQAAESQPKPIGKTSVPDNPARSVQEGTKPTSESPVPHHEEPVQNGLSHVPLILTELPPSYISAGVTQTRLTHNLDLFGVINQLENELAIVPAKPLDQNVPALRWFIQGTASKVGVVSPICAKYNLKWEARLNGNGLLEAILISGGKLEAKQLEDLKGGAEWAFSRALQEEPKK